MCGIIGVVGAKDVARMLVDGLKRLEYRGYDSAGIAIITPQGLAIERAVGAVHNLDALPHALGTVGVGHTRWATHGAPTETNSHPHRDCTERLAVVHNGIIENFQELREKLEANGHVFRSQTDTEVIAHLIEERFRATSSPPCRARFRARGKLRAVVVSADAPDRIVAARHEEPAPRGRRGRA